MLLEANQFAILKTIRLPLDKERVGEIQGLVVVVELQVDQPALLVLALKRKDGITMMESPIFYHK